MFQVNTRWALRPVPGVLMREVWWGVWHTGEAAWGLSRGWIDVSASPAGPPEASSHRGRFFPGASGQGVVLPAP